MQNVKINYYEILEISQDATFEEIKKAYRKQAFKYHPDRNPDDREAEEMMKLVNDAYGTLSDVEKRKDYDLELSKCSMNSSQHFERERNTKRYKDKHWFYSYWRSHTTKDDKEYYDSRKEQFKDILDKLIRSYKNSREFEKTVTFKNRHDYVTNEIFGGVKLFDDCETIEDYIKRFFTKDTLIYFEEHGYLEFAFICYKLQKLKSDDIPTYLMRNRRTFISIILALCLLNGITNDTKENIDEPVETTGVHTTVEEDNDMNLIDGYCLYRIYKVAPGDSLSKLSLDSNTTIDHIKEINHLRTDDIQVNQKLKIPYYIDKDEVKYYTKCIEIDSSTSFTDIAKKYETDERTLYALNIESFYFDGEKYIVMADSILVPTFPTQAEVRELKTKDSYRKTS